MAEDKLIQQVADRFDRIACTKCQTAVDVSALPFFATANCPSCGTPQTVPAQIGNFLLIGHLGAGGMAGVYEAHDRGLGRRVAIKILHTELGVDPKFIDSFLREARSAAQINHINVVQIFQVGQEKGVPFIVMELLKGGKLEDATNAGRKLGELQVLDIALDAAKGLRAADAIRLVHGDIKPANILFDKKGIAKIADFGLARFQGKSSALKGEIWGTPHYIAPETVRKQTPDARADIYSLGATIFHALAGRPPFEGKDTKEVVLARLKDLPPPLTDFRKDLMPETVLLVSRMLETDPNLRYPNYNSLIADIELALQAAKNRPVGSLVTSQNEKKSGSRKTYAAAGLVALAVVAGLIVATSGGKGRKASAARDGAPAALPAATANTPPVPVQPFSPDDEKVLVAGFDLLARGRDQEAVDAWLKWVKAAPAEHPGRPWLVVLHALPAFLAGDAATVQSRTKPLLDKKYGLQSDGSMHPGVMPQAVARLMATKKWQDPPANPKGAWPDWFGSLRKFLGGFAMFYNKDFQGGRVALLDVRNDKAPVPGWVAAIQPVASRYIGFFDQWDQTSTSVSNQLAQKDFNTALAELEKSRDRTPGLIHPLYDSLLDQAHKGANSSDERKRKPTIDLAFPWLRIDVGTVGESGASISNGVFKLKHRGGDIFDKRDSCHFVYQSKDGDGTIEARVMSVGNSDKWAKSALMIRDHVDPSSRNASLILAFSEGTQLQARGTNSDLTAMWKGPRVPAPYWIRLTRTGSKFEGFTSGDGLSWKSVKATTIDGFPSTALWGLAIASHNTNAASTAEFRNVTFR